MPEGRRSIQKYRRASAAVSLGLFCCFGPPAEDGDAGFASVVDAGDKQHRAAGVETCRPVLQMGTEKEIYLSLRFLLTTHAPPVRDSRAIAP